MGWEPERVTVTERDSRRRVIRKVTTTEPEWTPDEQAWMLALQLYEANRCPGCGQYLPDSTEPVRDANGDVDPVATSRAWRAELAAQCNACIALDNEAEGRTEHAHAMRYEITRRR
jgi:hypothetical protein